MILKETYNYIEWVFLYDYYYIHFFFVFPNKINLMTYYMIS